MILVCRSKVLNCPVAAAGGRGAKPPPGQTHTEAIRQFHAILPSAVTLKQTQTFETGNTDFKITKYDT